MVVDELAPKDTDNRGHMRQLVGRQVSGGENSLSQYLVDAIRTFYLPKQIGNCFHASTQLLSFQQQDCPSAELSLENQTKLVE